MGFPRSLTGRESLRPIPAGRENRRVPKVDISIKRIASRVAAGILLILSGLTVAHRDDVGNILARGFNETPRGPHPGITLKNPNADRRLQCYMDLFHDGAESHHVLPNGFVRRSCKDVVASLPDPHRSPNPLKTLTKERDRLLKAELGDIYDDYDPPPVEWRAKGGGLVVDTTVQVNRSVLAEIERVQRTTTGKTTFTVEE